ncbi:MAG: hypothetical protein ACXIT4_05315 [Erythrobacter sp.]
MNQPTENQSIEEAAEAQARHRYGIMNLARIGGLVLVLLGIAIAQGVVPLPYFLGVVLAVAGLAEFFFLPPMLARRWKAAERRETDNSAP